MNFSIIVPIYRTKMEYLRRCIESLLNQKTSHEYEVLLLDDNNYNDESGEYIDEISKENDNFHSFHHINHGVSFTRNKGIDIAKNDWIIFVDADDYVSDDFIEKISLNLSEKIDILMFNTFVINKKYVKKNSFFKNTHTIKKLNSNNLQKGLLTRGITKYSPKYIGYGVPWGKVYRKELFKKNGLYFDTKLPRMQDKVLNLILFEFTNRIYHIDDYLYFYRIHENSISRKKNNDIIDQHLKVFDEIEKFAIVNNKDSEFWNAFSVNKLISINTYFKQKFWFSKFNEYEFKTEIEALMNHKHYKNIFNNLLYSKMTWQEKMFVFLIKNKCYITYRIMFLFKKILTE